MTHPIPASNVVTTKTIYVTPHVSHVAIRSVALYPQPIGTLEPRSQFPFLVARVAPDGTTSILSNDRTFEAIDEPPLSYLASVTGDIWFSPTVGRRDGSGAIPVAFAGGLSATTPDGAAWLFGGRSLARVTSNGKAAYFRLPAKVSVNALGVNSGGGLLMYDDADGEVYDVSQRGVVDRLSVHPHVPFDTMPACPDGLWFDDKRTLTFVAGRPPHEWILAGPPGPVTMLSGDRHGVWVEDLSYAGTGETRLEHYALDGTVWSFSLPYRIYSETGSLRGDLVAVASSGRGPALDVVHVVDLSVDGRAVVLSIIGSVWNQDRTGIARLPDGSTVFGWNRRSFATISRDRKLTVTPFPRP